MANQTVTTVLNYDAASISGLLNGETITNNGGSLTINSDVRWAQQAAVMGNITCSAVLGGTVLIDGTTVWQLPFTASTGNVPTLGTLGTNGVTGGTSSATGELLRVWATGSLDPAAAGGATPATGFIKLRTKAGTFQAGEVVTLPGGATVTIADAGRRSWLHIVGAETLGITAARVAGTCSMTGDWYELGTTNGTDDQTFQFPVADYCPAIQIETSAGSGVYEWWLYADNRWGTATQFVATDVRGKYFGMNPATGVITIARRATNPCGFKPASGLKVRVPNLICSSSSSANWNANTFSATLSNRYRGIITGAATCDCSYDKVSLNWDLVPVAGRNFTLQNSSSMALRSIPSMVGFILLDNVGVGCTPAITINSGAVSSTGSASVTITKCRFVKKESGDVGNGDLALSISTAGTVTISDTQCEMFGATGSRTRSGTGGAATTVSISRCGATTITNINVIGGSLNISTNSAPGVVNGMTFADNLVGANVSTGTLTVVAALQTATDVTLSGPVSWFDGLSGVQPRNTIFSTSAASKRVVVQDVGTSAAPLDLGNQSSAMLSVSDTSNTIFRRCYAQNSRANLFVNASITYSDCDFDNCETDYADTNQISGIRSRIRGLKSGLSGAVTALSVGTNIADFFTSATSGRIIFTGGDPDPANPQLVMSGGAGAATSGAGSAILPNLNDTATWESPWFHLGHTALANSALTLVGTNTGNFNYDFQYDTGSGWNGTWLSATGANLSGIGAINPATGIKLKLRATVATASTTNALSLISVITVTTATDQDTLYPLRGNTVIIDNLIPYSRAKITRVDTGALLQQQSSAAGSTIRFDVPYSGTVKIEARNASLSQAYQPWVTQFILTQGPDVKITALQQTE